MKKSLVLSLLLHALIISLLLLIAHEKVNKGTPPFFTRLVSPDELKGSGGPLAGRRSDAARPQRRRAAPTPRIERANNQAPKPAAVRKTTEALSRPDIAGGDIRTLPGSSPEMGNKRPSGEIQGEGGGINKEARSPSAPRSVREMLNDPEIIGKLSREKKKDMDNSITFDTREYRLYGYMQRLREKIQGAWNYPAAAAERGIYGDLLISFTIKKDGRLGDIELVRTSGHTELDRAAMKALRDAEPYWPLPDDWDKKALTITGHFIYTLYGTYIR